MNIGLIPVNVAVPNVQAMIGTAQLCEGLGFESVWTFEHTIVPVDYASQYPYSPDGKMGVTPETNFVDPLIALAAVAAQTKTIRLGTGVNILSQANPLYVAKQAASLDFVSGGDGEGSEVIGASTRLWRDEIGETLERRSGFHFLLLLAEKMESSQDFVT